MKAKFRDRKQLHEYLQFDRMFAQTATPQRILSPPQIKEMFYCYLDVINNDGKGMQI